MSIVGWQYAADAFFVRFFAFKDPIQPPVAHKKPPYFPPESIQHSFVPSDKVGVRR
jgi:hypothetical protein